MTTVSIRIDFQRHPCTNMSEYDYETGECSDCNTCRCDEGDYCCGATRYTAYCPDCGSETDRPHCYACSGEPCGNCNSNGDGESFPEGEDVTYTGVVSATWKNGELASYTGYGHPHLNGTYCLDQCAPLFVGVTTQGQAVEAVVTHISNVRFESGLENGPYTGIGRAS